MTGLSAEDVVCAQWRALGPFRPAFVVCRDHEMRWLVVAVRGTLSVPDVLTDLAVEAAPFIQGVAHEGMLKAATNLLGEVEEVLQEELAALPGYQLMLCGHSMGAAVAALACAKLLHEASWAHDCVSFGIGTPGVMSRCISERLAEDRAVFTAVNGRDWSPRISVSNADELLDSLYELSTIRSLVRAVSGSTIAKPKAPNDRTEQLPPGIIVQIAEGVPKEESSSEETQAREAALPLPLRLLEAQPTDYRHSMQAWPDIECHIPLAYVDKLLRGYVSLLQGLQASELLEDERTADADAGGGAAGGGGEAEEALEEGGSPPRPASAFGRRALSAELRALRRIAGLTDGCAALRRQTEAKSSPSEEGRSGELVSDREEQEPDAARRCIWNHVELLHFLEAYATPVAQP